MIVGGLFGKLFHIIQNNQPPHYYRNYILTIMDTVLANNTEITE